MTKSTPKTDARNKFVSQQTVQVGNEFSSRFWTVRGRKKNKDKQSKNLFQIAAGGKNVTEVFLKNKRPSVEKINEFVIP